MLYLSATSGRVTFRCPVRSSSRPFGHVSRVGNDLGALISIRKASLIGKRAFPSIRCDSGTQDHTEARFCALRNLREPIDD